MGLQFQDIRIDKCIQNGTVCVEKLHKFYQEAIAKNQIEQVHHLLDTLQSHFPHEREIRKLQVALSLFKKDYPAAMGIIEKLVATSNPDDGLIDAALAVRGKIGPLPLDASKSGTVSLCMIVKNEIAGLGACLNAAKLLVDEIIVVDTGSTDRTADVARIFGARVFDYTWSDDFAAARNFSIDHAQGDWVLILDADEIIATRDRHVLKTLIADRNLKPIGFFIETRNYINTVNAVDWHANDGSYPDYEAGLGWFPTRKTRIFKRQDGIRFCHAVHEQVDTALNDANIPIVACQIPVHHYGHLNEVKNKKKAEKYFHIGYRKLEHLGNDLQALRELATQAAQLEYWPQSIELWERVLKIDSDYPLGYVNIASAKWQLGHYKEALSYSKRAIELDTDQKEAHYNLAVSLLMLGQAEKAIEIFKNLDRVYSGYLAARFMLAVCFSLIGEEDQSRDLFSKLQDSPVGAALGMAANDLSKKFYESGHPLYADAIRNTAQMFDRDSSSLP